MHVYNGLGTYPGQARPVVATVGNYDGVHRGHQKILRGVLERSRDRALRSLLITFEPHPLAIVAPERRPPLLMTRGQKLDHLEALGLDAVLILPFDARLAALSGEEFFGELGRRGVALAELRVGENFRFGHGRSGDLPLLQRIGRELGFDVDAVAPELVDGEPVSSSRVRAAVSDGDVERAQLLRGRPFELTGEVVRGDGRGRELRCPTANLAVDNELLPGGGVYITETTVLGARHASVTNVGVRPTFGRDALTVETHLLDFEGNLLRKRIAVRFLGRLRDEMKFNGIGELADQIARDIAAATAFFHNQPIRAG